MIGSGVYQTRKTSNRTAGICGKRLKRKGGGNSRYTIGSNHNVERGVGSCYGNTLNSTVLMTLSNSSHSAQPQKTDGVPAGEDSKTKVTTYAVRVGDVELLNVGAHHRVLTNRLAVDGGEEDRAVQVPQD